MRLHVHGRGLGGGHGDGGAHGTLHGGARAERRAEDPAGGVRRRNARRVRSGRVGARRDELDRFARPARLRGAVAGVPLLRRERAERLRRRPGVCRRAVPRAQGTVRRGVASAVPLHAAARLEQRSERTLLPRRRMAHVLPAQPVRRPLGQHALGTRRLEGPRALDGSRRRDRARRPRADVLRQRRDGPREHVGIRERRARAGLHGGGQTPHAAHRLVARRTPLREVAEGRRGGARRREPRPEGGLVRARRVLGAGRLRPSTARWRLDGTACRSSPRRT